MDTPLVSRVNAGFGFSVVNLEEHPGNVFFVDSGAAGAGDTVGHGRSKAAPFATLAYAFSSDVLAAGDVVYVMPGHAETVAGAAGINCDIAGVRVIGLGWGAKRPTFTLSAVASTVALAAASVHLKNLIFRATADCTIMLDVNAADCVVEDCEFRSTAAKEFVTAIDINGGAANACDRTTVKGCVIDSSLAAGASNGIELGEVADRVLIQKCTILGDYGDAAIHNPTGKVLTNLAVEDCFLENLQTGDHAIELVSACTGRLARNLYKSDMTQATAADPGSCFSYECYHCDAVDVSGILSPAVT